MLMTRTKIKQNKTETLTSTKLAVISMNVNGYLKIKKNKMFVDFSKINKLKSTIEIESKWKKEWNPFAPQ